MEENNLWTFGEHDGRERRLYRAGVLGIGDGMDGWNDAFEFGVLFLKGYLGMGWDGFIHEGVIRYPFLPFLSFLYLDVWILCQEPHRS